MNSILCSIGAFIGRVNDRDHRAFLRICDQLTPDGYEFLMYEAWYEREKTVFPDFLASGLSFPVFHIEKMIGELVGLGGQENAAEAERRFLKNCEYACRVGAKKTVMHLWNGLPSDHRFERHLASYARFAEISASYGLTLTVENVICASQSPLLRFRELLAAYPSILFTYDTKMAEFHGETLDLFNDINVSTLKNVAHIHLNDYGGAYRDYANLRVLHLGLGHVDLSSFSSRLLASGYQGTVTLECSSMNPDGTLTPEMTEASLKIARKLFS